MAQSIKSGIASLLKQSLMLSVLASVIIAALVTVVPLIGVLDREPASIPHLDSKVPIREDHLSSQLEHFLPGSFKQAAVQFGRNLVIALAAASVVILLFYLLFFNRFLKLARCLDAWIGEEGKLNCHPPLPPIKNRSLESLVNLINRLVSQVRQSQQEQETATVALGVSEEKYKILYEKNPSMFFTINLNGEILSVNQYSAQQLGYKTEELNGRLAAMIYNKGDADSVVHSVTESEPSMTREVCLVRKDGTIFWVRETAKLVSCEENSRYILVASEDVSEMRQLSRQLSHQSRHDNLTGLINRQEFEVRLKSLIAAIVNHGKQSALLYLDLDEFKIINDTCGHVAGDELLRQLTSVLKHKIYENSVLARLGGDEFAVLVENCTLKQAEVLARGICDAVNSFQFFWGNDGFRISVSIGLAMITSATQDAARLLSQADSACYAAKSLGRNRFHVFLENDSELLRRAGEMQWITKIESALEQERFELYIQPIVPVQNIKVTGKRYEVLVRMRDASGHVVSPAAFLTAAERFNLIGGIDRIVVNLILRWISLHPQHAQTLELCTINLSGRTLIDSGFLDFVLREFEQWNVDPSKICFEISETAAIENFAFVSEFAQALRNKGCKLSLDNFGSRLSSFVYLKDLPIDYINIDGLFVKSIIESSINQAVVRAINEIAHAMHKKTIAKFVGDDTALKILKDIGVDYAQGHYIAADEPISTLTTLI